MDSNNATRALLCKCFDHLNQEIARLSLNASAASGKQALSREIAEHLDALAAQQSVPPDRVPVPFKICHKCNHEFEVVGGNDNSGFTSLFQNCPHCQTRNDTWIHIPLNPERYRKNSRNADYSKPLPGIPVPPEARAVEAAEEALQRARAKYQDGFENVPFCELADAMQKLIASVSRRTHNPPGEGEEWAMLWKHIVDFIEECEVAEDRSNLDGDSAEAVLEQINTGAEELLDLIKKHAPARPTAADTRDT